MASAILPQLLDVILGNLGPAVTQKLQMVWGADVDKELENLTSTLSTVQAVLEDAEEQQFDSKAVQDWLQKLKHVSYDAEDLVDEMVTEAQQSITAESGNAAAASKKRKRWVDYFSPLLKRSQWNMSSKIREMNARLDQIAKERRDLHLKTSHGGRQLGIIREQQRGLSSSVRDESSQLLGREDDIKQMVEFLLSDDSSKGNISVIAIVGLGGVGKTTLAQLVYNEKSVTENFEMRAWVCVSEYFDLKRLTKEIIASATKRPCNLSDIDSLQCCLRDMLNGKKFLLVLDDVWSDSDRDWEQLQAPFTFGAKGSRIVVTTRSQAVSNAMQATCVHNVKCLSKEDCWSLFAGQAFKDETIDDYPGLRTVGEELVNKCGGLPLAARALGGLLSSKREVSDWRKILQSSIWGLPRPASNILPTLRLSYQHLPAHLKRCFTFCSVFPKDYIFSKKKLVQQWVANGFVYPEGGKQIEDSGSEYFNDLLQRSFFQIFDCPEIEALTTYKMHDLIHDLAQFISGNECFEMAHGRSHGALGKIQHLSYSSNHNEPINFESFYESKGLRTFLLMNADVGMVEKVPDETFERLRVIRVLDLHYSRITKLPNSIGKLKHLRYLDLSKSSIEELPESICGIYNLQTLLLSGCENLVVLPNNMMQLINLRHLDLYECTRIVAMPPRIGRLTCLQTLPRFIVGTEREGGIAELKELNSICGRHTIEKLENVAEAEDAQLANLKNKPFVDGLWLKWSRQRSDNWQNEQLEEEIANGLQPNCDLKTLELHGYMGMQFPSWMMKMDMLMLFSNLKVLRLSYCTRCSILPPLGCLLSLSNLYICNVEQVKQIGHELYGGMAAGGFPSLKELHIKEMLNLEEWHEREGAFPCLESLNIIDCPQLRQMPSNFLPNLTHLEVSRCSKLVSLQMPFSHLPNIIQLNISCCASLVSIPQLPSLKVLNLEDLGNLEEWCDAVVVGEAYFPHLQKLCIWKCPKMRQWPTILPVLTELSIINCQGLNELPPLLPSSLSKLYLGKVVSEKLLNSVSCLTCLSTLYISGIPSLTSMPRGMLQALTQLKDLRIHRCKELVTLADDVLPSTLTNFWLYNCQNLRSLPRSLHALTSLQSLVISDCPHLASLPDEGLPSSLESLKIQACPLLKERCMEGVGEDWSKISRISHVRLE